MPFHVSVYVRNVALNSDGDTLVTFDASRSDGETVSTVSAHSHAIPRAQLGTPDQVNARLMDAARAALGAEEEELTTLFGGVVRQAGGE